MRTWSTCLAMALFLSGSVVPGPASAADDFKLNGKWKLKYLDDFAKGSGFPAALPKMDFKSLAVVAFVQDDADKRVLHAVQASVPEAQ